MVSLVPQCCPCLQLSLPLSRLLSLRAWLTVSFRYLAYSQAKIALQEKLSALAVFFDLHNLPDPLLEKTSKYVAALWDVSGGVDPHSLLRELPIHLQEEILVAAHS